MIDCPACYRGKVELNICNRCGVSIARGATPSAIVNPRAGGWRRGDQQERRGMADYVATKEDHREGK